MATRIYKVYKSEDYDSLDLSKFYSNIRWSLDGTQFIAEFIEKPHGNTVTMNRDEAVAFTNNEQWIPQVDL